MARYTAKIIVLVGVNDDKVQKGIENHELLGEGDTGLTALADALTYSERAQALLAAGLASAKHEVPKPKE